MSKVTDTIRIYGSKNTNKQNKPLRFDDFDQREYYVNPTKFEYADPFKCLVFFENNIVFKVPHIGAIGFDATIDAISAVPVKEQSNG